MSSSRVFILCAGENSEGQFPMSAHWSFIDAVRASGIVRTNWTVDQSPYKGVRAWKAMKELNNPVDELWIYHLNIKSSIAKPVKTMGYGGI